MFTQKQLRIIDVYRKNLFGEFTIRELARALRGASYSWTFNVVKELVKLRILEESKKGGSNVCTINLDEPLTLEYLSLLDELEAFDSKVPKKSVVELMAAIPSPFFTFMVAGSYAKGTQTKSSDIDVVILVDDSLEPKKVLSPIKNKSELMIPEIHPYVFKKSEFLQMLLAREENYGKMVYANRLIFFGAGNYYLIIKEAIAHGFRG